MFWVGVCLRLGLICVEISMVVGIFVGEWGELVRVRIGWGKRGLKPWDC